MECTHVALACGCSAIPVSKEERERVGYSRWYSTNSPPVKKNAAESLVDRSSYPNALCTTVMTHGGCDGNRRSGEREEGVVEPPK